MQLKTMKGIARHAAVLVGAALLSLSPSVRADAIAIEHVTVIPMTTDGAVLRDQTVLIEGERIKAIGPAQETRVSEGARRVNARGKYLMPGLTDMHAHVLSTHLASLEFGDLPESTYFDLQDQMTLYVANGITQIFDCAALPETLGQRQQLRSGRVLGPHLATAGIIDGEGSPFVQALNPAEGRALVRAMKSFRFDFIKVYSRLDRDTYAAILDEANQQGMKVIGHIPNAFRGMTQQAFVPGLAMVAHAEEFGKQAVDFSDEEARRFAAIAKHNGTWLIATATTSHWIALNTRSLDKLRELPTLKYLPPLMAHWWTADNRYRNRYTPERADRLDAIDAFNTKLIRAFVEAGVPVLPGTDAPLPGLTPGYSLHDELEALVSLGVPVTQVLSGATRQSAEWLGVGNDRGTLQPGKRADLLLLDADPLGDVTNTRKISAVALNGRWLERVKLDEMLNELARRNAAPGITGSKGTK